MRRQSLALAGPPKSAKNLGGKLIKDSALDRANTVTDPCLVHYEDQYCVQARSVQPFKLVAAVVYGCVEFAEKKLLVNLFLSWYPHVGLNGGIRYLNLYLTIWHKAIGNGVCFLLYSSKSCNNAL